MSKEKTKPKRKVDVVRSNHEFIVRGLVNKYAHNHIAAWHLLMHYQIEGKVFMSYSLLADHLQCGRNYARDTLKHLIDTGEIEIEKKGRSMGNATSYIMNVKFLKKDKSNKKQKESSKNSEQKTKQIKQKTEKQPPNCLNPVPENVYNKCNKWEKNILNCVNKTRLEEILMGDCENYYDHREAYKNLVKHKIIKEISY